MQPDRSCYVRRRADDELLGAIASEQFAYVLAPRATGKSSLMGRAIRRLRADGQLAAVVDLAQIVNRADDTDATRWHYSIAYRLCRELRLRFDLQRWWHDHQLLPHEQRLADFFWDGILSHTQAPVTVFFDEAERIADLPLSIELIAALHAAYTRRVSEPDYMRLNFVALGAATPGQLCLDPAVSPFAGGRAVALDDFSVDECYRLAAGLDLPEADARRVIERVYTFTHGQPYLTQKVLRGIARKGGGVGDVEPVVHELLLAPGIIREEPYLSQMRSIFRDRTTRGRHSQAVLVRLTRGGEVIDDPQSPAQAALYFAGFVSSDENGMLRFRNRVAEYVAIADANAAPRRPRRDRRLRRSAAAAVFLVLLGYWYTQVLPEPYIDTLTLVSTDYALAQQSHERLARLPGFGRLADRLLVDVMTRRSRQAVTLDEVRAADTALRGLPGGDAEADRLLAEFWLRQSDSAALRGERDVALTFAATAIEAGSTPAINRARSLISGDYPALVRTLRFETPLLGYAVDWQRGHIVAVDTTQTVHRRDIDTGSAGANLRNRTLRLTALRHVGVTRGVFVDGSGRAGRLELHLTIDHARPADLLVRLRAPGGSVAEIELPARPGGLEQFVIAQAASNGLAALADETVTGQWELSVHDRLTGDTGQLLRWGLRFPSIPGEYDDVPLEGVPLPDPVATEQVSVVLAGDGRRAVAVPSQIDASGAASVWDLGSESRVADFPLGDRVEFVGFVADDAILIAGATRARLWRIDSSEPVAELTAAEGFAVPPLAGPAGEFFATAEARDDRVGIRVMRVASGETMAELDVDAVTHWSLGRGGARLAVVDGTRRGQVLDVASGDPIVEFFHDRPLDRVWMTGDRVVAVDRIGEISAWPIDPSQPAVAPTDGTYLGTTTGEESIVVADDGSYVAFFESGGNVTAARTRDGYRIATLGHGSGTPLGLAASEPTDRLVSAADTALRIWRLPAGDGPDASQDSVSALALDDRGSGAVLGYRNGTVRFVGDVSRTTTRNDRPHANKYIGHRGIVTGLAFNRERDLAASGSSDGVVRLWDTRTNSPSRYLLRHPRGAIASLAFSPDDRWLAAAATGSARIFALDTGELIGEIEVEGGATTVRFSPNGRTVAVGDSTGNIHLTAPDGGQAAVTFRGRSPITALRFADRGDLLVSGSRDGRLMLWDTAENRATGPGMTFAEPIRWIDTDTDGSEIRVQSGSWLVVVERRADRLVTIGSTLLPPGFRGRSAFALDGPHTVRALADRGAGQLALRRIPLIQVAGTEVVPDRNAADQAVVDPAGGLAAGWSSLLAMDLDPGSGRVRPVYR